MARRRFKWNPLTEQMEEQEGLGDYFARTGPDVMGDLPGYESPITGEWIEGRAARARDLKRHGCRPYEDGERQDYQKRCMDDEAKLSAGVSTTVRKHFYETLNARGRERLIEDMRRGSHGQYTRGQPRK